MKVYMTEDDGSMICEWDIPDTTTVRSHDEVRDAVENAIEDENLVACERCGRWGDADVFKEVGLNMYCPTCFVASKNPLTGEELSRLELDTQRAFGSDAVVLDHVAEPNGCCVSVLIDRGEGWTSNARWTSHVWNRECGGLHHGHYCQEKADAETHHNNRIAHYADYFVEE